MTRDERIDSLPPPRCLAELRVLPVEDPGVELDTLVEAWPERFLAVACRCGDTRFTVNAHVDREEFLGIDRISGAATLICGSCGRGAIAFDPALHGYDVEIDYFPTPGPTAGVRKRFGCPACARTSFTLVVRFQYPARVLEERWPAGGPQPKPEDLFSYFSLLGRCAGCREWTTLQSTECS